MKPAQIISYADDTFRNLVLSNRPALGDEAIRRAKDCRARVRELCAAAFPNLDDYKYVFFTAGATEAIDFLVTKQPTSAAPNEYRYVFAHPTVSTVPAEMHFQSYPFSGTGNRDAIRTDIPVILDASYIFCTKTPLSPPIPKNVAHVIFSLSKSHNLHDYRCGWFFTNTRFPGLYTLQYEYGYMSMTTQACVMAASSRAANQLYMNNASAMSAIYSRADMTEAEVNLFGFTKTGDRVPYYKVGT